MDEAKAEMQMTYMDFETSIHNHSGLRVDCMSVDATVQAAARLPSSAGLLLYQKLVFLRARKEHSIESGFLPRALH